MTDDDKALCTAIKAWGYSDIVHGRKTRGEALREAADRIEAQAAEIARLREALNYAWDLIEEASYSDSVMGVKRDRFLSTYYDENGLRAALGETE
jgi:hypothetical protein